MVRSKIEFFLWLAVLLCFSTCNMKSDSGKCERQRMGGGRDRERERRERERVRTPHIQRKLGKEAEETSNKTDKSKTKTF